MENSDEKPQGTAEEGITGSSKFFLLLILGVILIFVGIIVVFVSAVLNGGGSANVGAVIFIGPFPILVGAGADVNLMLLVGVVLAVLSIVVFLVMNRRARRSGG